MYDINVKFSHLRKKLLQFNVHILKVFKVSYSK